MTVQHPHIYVHVPFTFQTFCTFQLGKFSGWSIPPYMVHMTTYVPASVDKRISRAQLLLVILYNWIIGVIMTITLNNYSICAIGRTRACLLSTVCIDAAAQAIQTFRAICLFISTQSLIERQVGALNKTSPSLPHHGTLLQYSAS